MPIGIYAGREIEELGTDQFNLSVEETIIGYAGLESLRVDRERLPFYSTTELLEQIDTLLILGDNQECFQTAVHAIRKGKHVFLEDISQANRIELEEWIELSQEIGVKLGVGNSGQNLSNFFSLQTPQKEPLYIEAKRTISALEANDTLLKILWFDMGTLSRLTNSSIRKIRVGKFPVLEERFNLMSLRLEFCNGTIFSYTLSIGESIELLSVSPYIDNQRKIDPFVSQLPFQLTIRNALVENFQNFLSFEENDSFPTDKMLEMSNILQRILEILKVD